MEDAIDVAQRAPDLTAVEQVALDSVVLETHQVLGLRGVADGQAQLIAAIREETGVDDYALLWSVKEYKKVRVRYFTDDWDDWRDAHLPAASPA